jgi:ribosomal protein L18E
VEMSKRKRKVVRISKTKSLLKQSQEVHVIYNIVMEYKIPKKLVNSSTVASYSMSVSTYLKGMT